MTRKHIIYLGAAAAAVCLLFFLGGRDPIRIRHISWAQDPAGMPVIRFTATNMAENAVRTVLHIRAWREVPISDAAQTTDLVGEERLEVTLPPGDQELAWPVKVLPNLNTLSVHKMNVHRVTINAYPPHP